MSIQFAYLHLFPIFKSLDSFQKCFAPATLYSLDARALIESYFFAPAYLPVEFNARFPFWHQAAFGIWLLFLLLGFAVPARTLAMRSENDRIVFVRYR